MRGAVLFGLPLAIMLVSIVLSTGNAFANGAPVSFSGNSQQSVTLVSFSCNSVNTPCFGSASTLPQNSVISCQSTSALPGQSVNSCELLQGVCYVAQNGGTYGNSLFCSQLSLFTPFNTYLTSGSSITVSQSGVPTNNNNNAFFNFGGIGPAGFVAMIVVVIAVAVLAGITILGSGLNSESVRLLVIGGFFVGLWAILSVADGFLAGSQGSLFTQLNLVLTGLGSIFYVIMSLLWVIGTITTMSSGGGGA